MSEQYTEYKDLCITWPKKRSFDSYLEELSKAWEANEVICFRVPTLPKQKCEFCYVVHDGMLRGFTRIRGYGEMGDGEVKDPISGEYLPAGNYIVRIPFWHPLQHEKPMKGFQGYRYIDRPEEV